MSGIFDLHRKQNKKSGDNQTEGAAVGRPSQREITQKTQTLQRFAEVPLQIRCVKPTHPHKGHSLAERGSWRTKINQ